MKRKSLYGKKPDGESFGGFRGARKTAKLPRKRAEAVKRKSLCGKKPRSLCTTRKSRRLQNVFKKYEKVKEEEAKGNNLRGGKIPENKRVSGGAEGEENGKDEVKL